MRRGERTPEEIVDYVLVERFLFNTGQVRLSKMLKQRGVELTGETIRKLIKKNGPLLRSMIRRALNRKENSHYIERMHTHVILRAVDLTMVAIKEDRESLEGIYDDLLTHTYGFIVHCFLTNKSFEGLQENIDLFRKFLNYWVVVFEEERFDDSKYDEMCEVVSLLKKIQSIDRDGRLMQLGIIDASGTESAERNIMKFLDTLYLSLTDKLSEITKQKFGPDSYLVEWRKKLKNLSIGRVRHED